MATQQALRLRAAAQQLATCSEKDLEDACLRMRQVLRESERVDVSACVDSEVQALRDVRLDTAFSVDADATNECIHREYITRERDARQRVRFASRCPVIC